MSVQQHLTRQFDEIDLSDRRELKALGISYKKVEVPVPHRTWTVSKWEVKFPAGTQEVERKENIGMRYDIWTTYTLPSGEKFTEHESKLWKSDY